MSEFIKSHPIFSYIAVPALFVVLVFLVVIILRPRGQRWDYFSKLYDTLLESIDFVAGGQKTFSRENLKTLIKMLAKMKFYYELLESEELYEVEGIIKNIDNAAGIAKALYVSKATAGEISDYLADIDTELKNIRKVLYGFKLTREDDKTSGFSGLNSFNSKKSRKKAEDYLKNIKK